MHVWTAANIAAVAFGFLIFAGILIWLGRA